MKIKNKNLMILLILLMVTIFVILAEYQPLLLPDVNIQMSEDVSRTLTVHGCFWQNNGTKYKCRYDNIGSQDLPKKFIKAIAYDKENNEVGMLLFPKYHIVSSGKSYRESFARINSRYEISKIYLVLNDNL